MLSGGLSVKCPKWGPFGKFVRENITRNLVKPRRQSGPKLPGRGGPGPGGKRIMIDLEKRISDDLVAAMKAKKGMELSALRMLKAEFQRAKTEKGHSGDLSKDEVIALIQRLVKQRRDAADQFVAVGVDDRAAQELNEAIFLEIYLPEQLSDEELERIVEEAAALAKAAGPKDMGRVMGKAMISVKGQADGKRVKAKVQEYLQALVE